MRDLERNKNDKIVGLCHRAFLSYQKPMNAFLPKDAVKAVCSVQTNSMEHSHYLEAKSFTFIQEILRILWQSKAQYRVLRMVPVLRHMNPVKYLHPISLRSILILSSHLYLVLPEVFSFVFLH
jgi:ribosome biogenesis protein Tsr3